MHRFCHLALITTLFMLTACGGRGGSSSTTPSTPTTPETPSTTYTATTASQQQTTLKQILLPAGYTDYGILVNGGYTLQASNGQNTISIALQAINLNDLCNTSNAISIAFAP